MSSNTKKTVNLPRYFAGKRKYSLLVLVILGMFQAALAIVIAFKMRALFADLRTTISYQIPVDLVCLIALCSLLIVALRIIERALAEQTGYDYTMELRTRLFSHLTRISQHQLDQQRQGAINLRFIGDINAIKNWVSMGIPRLITASLLLPALLYVLYWLHPYMAGLAAVVLVCALSLLTACKDLLLPYHQQVRSKRGGIASYMNERVRFAPQLRISGQRNKTINTLRRRSGDLKSAAVKKSLIAGSFKALPEISLCLISAGCFSLAFYLKMGTAEAAVILAILAVFTQPLKDVADFWDKRNAFKVASRKCLEILNTPSVSKGSKIAVQDSQQPNIHTNKLVFQGLHFASVHIPYEHNVLVVGKNGSGKSTYLKILAGMTKPNRGAVSIGGANVLTLPEQQRSRLIFYQGTEVAIFKGTLKRALLFGCKQSVGDEQLLKVASMFGLDPVLSRLGGLSGKVQESGRNLSAGECKKVALCRAWLSDCRILLLDEIDDALDNASLPLVNKLLEKADTTVVLISHRMMDSDNFDQVINLLQSEPTSAST